jgi:hypothetical protein
MNILFAYGFLYTCMSQRLIDDYKRSVENHSDITELFTNIQVALLYVKLIRYQFLRTRCAFRLLKCSCRKIGNPKKVKTERTDKNQIESHEIEPNPSKDRAMHEGDNPSF